MSEWELRQGPLFPRCPLAPADPDARRAAFDAEGHLALSPLEAAAAVVASVGPHSLERQAADLRLERAALGAAEALEALLQRLCGDAARS